LGTGGNKASLCTKDYINFRLTGRLATDCSYASGSGVYDLLGWDYSKVLRAGADLPRSLFPEIVPSTEILGSLTTGAAEALGLPRDIPVACGAAWVGTFTVSQKRRAISFGMTTAERGIRQRGAMVETLPSMVTRDQR